jgi:RIO kinase 1
LTHDHFEHDRPEHDHVAPDEHDPYSLTHSGYDLAESTGPFRRSGRRDRRPPRSRPRTGRDALEGPAPGDVRPALPDGDPAVEPEPAYSSWLGAVHGPEPRPPWVVTELGAVDTDLGLLKTGKEADVHLVERAVPGTTGSLLAAKRYRPPEHRLFHRDAGYLEGRRVRRSREMRAMARRTDFGRDILSQQWAAAEFGALSRLWEVGRRRGGIRVPYPVQLSGTELMLEFVGTPDGVAAPRLAQLRPDAATLADLWEQLVLALRTLAAEGLAHGDLSPYNLLVHDGELVLIDLPQVVDVVANPQGATFLARDVEVTAAWFTARGLPAAVTDPGALTADLLATL